LNLGDDEMFIEDNGSEFDTILSMPRGPKEVLTASLIATKRVSNKGYVKDGATPNLSQRPCWTDEVPLAFPVSRHYEGRLRVK